MLKNKKKSNFNIPDPSESLLVSQTSSKYCFGSTPNNLNEIKHHKPIFAFDFVSLDKNKYCFNSSLIQSNKDYHRFFESLKKISSKTYDELSKDSTYHFHDVDFSDISIPQSDFIKCLTKNHTKVNPDHAPTVYQFKIFDKARIFGFIYNFVFYFVFLDRNHNAYKRK